MKDYQPEDHSAESPSDAKQSTFEGLKPDGMKAVQGETTVRGEWKDHGVIDVPVADLPQPEDVNSPEDFEHHISWEDAKSVTLQLPEVQKQVNAGKTGDDFSADDQAAGLDYSQGKRRVFDLYYGSNPVTLSKDGDNYDIASGRHRVFAAKELGLSSIPAHVKEKQEIRQGISFDSSPSDETDNRLNFVPISPETKMELIRIKNLPIEERRQAMGDFFNSERDFLGNQTKEGEYLGLDSKVLNGGKGIVITDADGTEYVINYEE